MPSSLLRRMLLQQRQSGISAVSTTNLISVWHLDETSSTRNDSHGTNHLADNNTVTQETGKFSSAAQFTIANSEFLSVASNSTLQTGDIDFTLGCWVYVDSVSGTQSIIGKWDDTSTTKEYAIWLRASPSAFIFYVSNNGSAAVGAQAATPAPPIAATWYFIVAWHDATANTINISVNNATPTSAAHTTGVFSSTSPFRIGAIESGQYYGGRVDEAFFFKRVLTAAERTFLYNGGTGRTVV